MSLELYDGYRTAGHHLAGLRDWYLGQVIAHGLIPVLAAGTVAVLATVCGIGGAWYGARRVRDWWRRGNERVADALAQYTPAWADTPASSAADDLRTCRHILAATDNQTRKEKP